MAARRVLLETLPFTTGYGVDVGLLIDACERCGMHALAQVDLDQRQNRHRPLSELAPMAVAVTDAIVSRLSVGATSPRAVVRPPAATLRTVGV